MEVELMSLDEAWRQGDWPCVGWKGWHGDPTAAHAVRRAGRSKALESERESLRATIEEARTLAQGVGELLGEGYGDALLYRYVESMPWRQVAELLGVCERTAYARAATGLDLIDSLGVARVRAGRGMAAV